MHYPGYWCAFVFQIRIIKGQRSLLHKEVWAVWSYKCQINVPLHIHKKIRLLLMFQFDQQLLSKFSCNISQTTVEFHSWWSFSFDSSYQLELGLSKYAHRRFFNLLVLNYFHYLISSFYTTHLIRKIGLVFSESS